MNKYRGQVPIELDGKELILQYDLDSLAVLNSKLGDQGHMKLMAATSSCDVDVLALGISIGLERNHPGEYSPESIKAISPPVVVAVMQDAVYEALIAAWHGPGGVPDENPQMRLKDQAIDWWTRLVRRKKLVMQQG